jgi:hypothetical protein
MESLKYSGPDIEEYFSTHRTSWGGFYPSERSLIESVWPIFPPHVLDIGSACGGLGMALEEHFNSGLASYSGVELNTQAVDTARRMSPAANFIEGDFLTLKDSEFKSSGYDLVFSLSCVDWQVNTFALLERAWGLVAPGGLLILSLRLTLDDSCEEFSESFQFINYRGLREGERAPYVVLNAGEVAKIIRILGTKGLAAHGYWGTPSATAVTPYSSLCFTVLALAKSEDRLGSPLALALPAEVEKCLQICLDG